jgi:hypothetical protein
VLLSRLHVSSLLNVTLHLYMITGKNLSTPITVGVSVSTSPNFFFRAHWPIPSRT